MWLPEVRAAFLLAFPVGQVLPDWGKLSDPDLKSNSSSDGTQGPCPHSQPIIWGGLHATGVPLKPELYSQA